MYFIRLYPRMLYSLTIFCAHHTGRQTVQFPVMSVFVFVSTPAGVKGVPLQQAHPFLNCSKSKPCPILKELLNCLPSVGLLTLFTVYAQVFSRPLIHSCFVSIGVS